MAIIFTKPDLEHSFEDKTEVIAYSTNGGSLGGIKVSHFTNEVARQLLPPNNPLYVRKYPRPEKWRDNGYPSGRNFPGRLVTPHDEYLWQFPVEDERYIEFQYEVIRRESKQDPNYDRDRNKDLRGIRAAIDHLAEEDAKKNPGSGGTGTTGATGTGVAGAGSAGGSRTPPAIGESDIDG